MAVEYIRGLQRLLAEADGLAYDSNSNTAGLHESIPSPTDSSSSISTTHNGSANGGDVMCLTGELDEHQSIQEETNVIADEEDGDSYLMEEEDEELEKDRREKRFRENSRTNNRYAYVPLRVVTFFFSFLYFFVLLFGYY